MQTGFDSQRPDKISRVLRRRRTRLRRGFPAPRHRSAVILRQAQDEGGYHLQNRAPLCGSANHIKMIYNDRVYGRCKIDEPVILELIKSPSLQRLKGVDQAGYRPLWVKPDIKLGRYDNTRFAHSLGVYLLLKRYGAPLPEQVAGLIHDVSHSAFSHCIDYVLNSGSQKEHSHQDNFFDDYVRASEIPAILKRHGFDLEYILNDKNFPLKENNLPDLCADRIDYALRMAVIFGEIRPNDLKIILHNLITLDNQWVFKNFASAQKFAKLFYSLNAVYLSGFKSAVMFLAVGDCVKYSLLKNYVSKADLYATDKQVLNKIKINIARDGELARLWRRMNGLTPASSDDERVSRVYCKSRIVDPLFLKNGRLARVSRQDQKWAKIIERELKPKEYRVKFDDFGTSWG